MARDRDDYRYDEAAADHARFLLRHYVDGFPSQSAAAKALGLDASTLSRAMHPARQPSLKIALALARATGATLDRVFGLDLQRPATIDASSQKKD